MGPFAAIQSKSNERARRRAALMLLRRRAAIWAVVSDFGALTFKSAIVAVAVVALLGVFRASGPEHRVDIDAAAAPVPMPLLVNADADGQVELHP